MLYLRTECKKAKQCLCGFCKTWEECDWGDCRKPKTGHNKRMGFGTCARHINS